MDTILVRNGYTEGWLGEYIGRGGKGKTQSPLANPYRINKTLTREESLAAYRAWLWGRMQDKNTLAYRELKRLAYKWLDEKQLVLDCFCKPKECHGDVIKAAIEYLVTEDYFYPAKIISGGQTGADFAGLVAANCIGLATGGTAPKDYRIDLKTQGYATNLHLRDFGLVEDTSKSFKPRTRKNVQDSDGTVWVGNKKSPGAKCTLNFCLDLKKPHIVNPTFIELRNWLHEEKIKVLNVAGNREHTNPGIFIETFLLIMDAIKK